MKKSINIDYWYENTLSNKVELWMILPEKVIKQSKKTKQVHNVPTGEILSYFVLQKNEKIHFNFDVDWYKPENHGTSLTNEEKKYYLRNTILSPINEETTTLAKKITEGEKSEKDQAYEIFKHIVKSYKYKYPPISRGTLSFLKERKGDCGEFSFLFSSLCRSIGIPTRTVFGGWSDGKMNGHAWNEIFLSGVGWFPVDTSMANILRKNCFSFLTSNIKTMHWKKYFGQTEEQRVVFSRDAEIKLSPSYNDSVDKSMLLQPFYINDAPFYWGQESLNGNAPYLQPAYVKFNGDLDISITTVKSDNLIGNWKTKENGLRGVLNSIKKGLLFPSVIIMIMSFLLDNLILDLVYKIGFISVFLCFILRKERPVIFSILLALMVLSMLSTISRLST
ncbi:transglutaminase-like domain-containing protein [Peribacillus sp. NPDC006672]|uniref:transglutaminase-like domain-containing protein n=1 Tax=Peribacillus sp. NPDC006672 TaxID=3390606 RepID=UPI003CFEAF92